jgi:hypothetical protein
LSSCALHTHLYIAGHCSIELDWFWINRYAIVLDDFFKLIVHFTSVKSSFNATSTSSDPIQTTLEFSSADNLGTFYCGKIWKGSARTTLSLVLYSIHGIMLASILPRFYLKM